MQNNEVHQYLEKYFAAVNCQITDQSAGSMTIQLTPEIDKELMNRPFYWHYAEKTGQKGVPMSLTLITDQEQAPPDIKGEIVHFGSPRLQQIFQSAKRHASYVRLYEQKAGSSKKQLPMHPWLAVNFKVSYQADRKKESLHSLGLNLINGTIAENFIENKQHIHFTPKIPDMTFTITPLIKPKSGVMRLQRFLASKIKLEDHSWSEEARSRWSDDAALLDYFYSETEEKPEAYQIEQTALQHQYEPRIIVDIINGGIFYMHTENK